MSFLDELIAPLTLAQIRAKLTGYMQAAGLAVTNWRTMSVAAQMLESHVAAAFFFLGDVPQIVRGFASLDTSFDPGDDDPFDPENVNSTPEAGLLSTFGKGTFGTEREDATFAEGFATFVNAGPGSRDISPGGLIWTWTGGSPPSPAPTYTNPDDPTTYPLGSITVPAGSSVVLPVRAQVQGAFASAPTNALSLTTSLVGCTSTNDLGAVVGGDREDAPSYKARCRLAASRVSLGGPAAAYEYFATKNLDGSVLLNDGTPPVPIGITRVQVTQDSATGVVNAYFASGAGAAIPDDVSAANGNIEAECMAVPDAITYTGVAATPLSIHVVGTARIRSRPGITRQAVAEAMVAALITNGELIPIGGVDQVSGSGVVYTSDLEAFARGGYPGVYDVAVSLPAGVSTAMGVGRVPVILSDPGDGAGSADWNITLV